MSELHHLDFVKPSDIENKSFQLIDEELALQGIVLDEECAPVVKRVIHTTADFDYAHTLTFTPDAIQAGVDALRAGCPVITDTSMAQAGINKRVLGRFGGEVITYIADSQVAAQAKERGLTRSAVSMEFACALKQPVVFAIGNAPTALVRLYELIQAHEMVTPALIIGVPVGFVNVVESKDLIRELSVPSIVTRGRKGGSTVAAAIVNALLYKASNNERE